MRRFAALVLLALPLPGWAATAVQTVAADRIVAAAQAQLDNCLGADKASAQVTVVGKPDDVTVLQGNVTLDAHRPDGRCPRARVGMAVDIRVNGELARSATVWFAISVHRQVLSYGADAKLDAPASSLNFTPHDADVALLQSDAVADPTELTGLRLRHAVVSGSPVVREDFERTPDVDRQQRVDVIASFGVIRMQTKGTAIGRGNTGEMVSVLVDGAEEPVRARVTDKGVVNVVE